MIKPIKSPINVNGPDLKSIIKEEIDSYLECGFTIDDKSMTIAKGSYIIRYSQLVSDCEYKYDSLRDEYNSAIAKYNSAKINDIIDNVNINIIKPYGHDDGYGNICMYAEYTIDLNGLNKHVFKGDLEYKKYGINKFGIIESIAKDCYTGLALADMRTSELRSLLKYMSVYFNNVDFIEIVNKVRDEQKNIKKIDTNTDVGMSISEISDAIGRGDF